MIVRMSQPWRHPNTGMFYYRSRLPADLAAMAGRTLTVEVGGESRVVKVGSIVKVSLRTPDPSEARLRHAAVQDQIERWRAAERKGEVSLTHKQIMGLAGIWYRELVTDHSDEPGSPDDWEMYRSLLDDGLAYFNSEEEDGSGSSSKQGVRILSRLGVNVDQFLDARGLKVDETTRSALTQQCAQALWLASRTLEKRARGDYSRDTVVERYPAWEGQKQRGDGMSLTSFFEGWAKESCPKQSTVELWRGYIKAFIEFVGHDDAADIRRQDVVAWKQHLIDLLNSPKTINGGKLAALKAVLQWAVEQDALPTNVAAKVTVRRKRNAGQRMLGFERAEAAIILRAASQEKSHVYRWVPLLCAQSGARVAEICQLRAEDIKREADIWYMSFRPEAGSLKNEGSERKVPLHDYVIEVGFLGFLQGKKGPLFYNPARGRADAKKPRPKVVAKNVASWVHKLGLEGIGRSSRKDPNHAWRHLFRTLARDVGIPESVSSALTGHGPSSVGQAYGETWLTTAARELNKLPLRAIALDSETVPAAAGVGAK